MNPGVQMPHCRAACPRKASWIACSPSGGATPLDRLEFPALGLDGQHQATVDRPTVEDHGAGPTVAVGTPFLGADQVQIVAEHFQQCLPRCRQELHRVSVDRGGYDALFGHRFWSVMSNVSCESKTCPSVRSLPDAVTCLFTASPSHRLADHPIGEHTADVLAEFYCSSHVIDRSGRFPGRVRGLGDSLLGNRLPRQGSTGSLDPKRGQRSAAAQPEPQTSTSAATTDK